MSILVLFGYLTRLMTCPLALAAFSSWGIKAIGRYLCPTGFRAILWYANPVTDTYWCPGPGPVMSVAGLLYLATYHSTTVVGT